MQATRIGVRDLKARMDQGEALLIIDVRRGFCDSDKMIPGAIHLDASHLNPKLFKLQPDTHVIVYDNASQNETAVQIVEALRNAGYQADALQGGWNEWLQSGFPTVERRENPLINHGEPINLEESTGEPREQSASMLARGTEQVQEVAGNVTDTAGDLAHGVTSTVGEVVAKAVSLVRALLRR